MTPGTQYNGKPSIQLPWIPTAKNIASSTHATPIVITTSTAHGWRTGDHVMVEGHSHTAANGLHEIRALTPTTAELVNTVGTTTGGASGTARSAAFGTTFPLVSDSDPARNGSTWNAAYEALANMCALNWRDTHFKGRIYAGGSLTIDERASLFVLGNMFLGAASSTTCVDGSAIQGELSATSFTLNWGSGADLNVTSGGAIDLHSGASMVLHTGSVLTAFAGGYVKGTFDLGDGTAPNDCTMRVQAESAINVLDGGEILVKNGAVLSFEDGSTIQNRPKLHHSAIFDIEGVINVYKSGGNTGAIEVSDDGELRCLDGAVVKLETTLSVGGSSDAGRIDCNTTAGGRVTEHMRDVANENGYFSHNVTQGTVIHLTGDDPGTAGGLTIHLSESNAVAGDRISAYTVNNLAGTITVRSGGSGGSGGTIIAQSSSSDHRWGGVFYFGGSSWRAASAGEIEDS